MKTSISCSLPGIHGDGTLQGRMTRLASRLVKARGNDAEKRDYPRAPFRWCSR